MHLLFLDESGSLDGNKGLFRARRRGRQRQRVAGIAPVVARRSAGHKWPLDREVKWHGIRKGEVPDALADGVFDALASARSAVTSPSWI